MVLETDNRLSKDQVLLALRSFAVSDFCSADGKLKGAFKDSGIVFSYENAGVENYVIAEGPVKLNWNISSRMIFHYVNGEFESCSRDLHKFLHIIRDITSANFVLSFQYEGFYAIRDEAGLKLLQNF